MNYGYVESSPHRCRPCDKQRVLVVIENDDGEDHRLAHVCECCGDELPDGVWRIDIADAHKAVERYLSMSSAEVDKILAELGVGARNRMEARLA